MRRGMAIVLCAVLLLSSAQIAPIARAEDQLGALQDGPAIARPAAGEVVVRDDMRTGSLFWARSCTTGNNVGTHEADGLRLSVKGRCGESSSGASADAAQPDTTMGDGEARFEFRIEQGWERAVVSVLLLSPGAEGSSLMATVIPSAGAAGLTALSAEGPKRLGIGPVTKAALRPNAWTSLALQRVGERAWLIVNDVPVLVAEGAPTDVGTILASVSRSGSVSDSAEVVATFRGFTASNVDGGDPGRGVERAARPVRDPRFDRILAFIQSDLVGDPGTDAASSERRAIGTAILEMLEATNVNLEVVPLLDGNAARFGTFERVVQVDERLMTFTPHVATMLLMHEIVHAHQERTGHVRGCFDRELDAVTWENRLWRAWFGPGGKDPPGDDIERLFTYTVRLEERGQLEEAVKVVYQEQCFGR